ncbi:MAG TPA: alpha,alpha-trehalase TreF [Chlamydiales bacterium]|nr:alpha,alpha-trehalase TreF [Chlamydiales bacterium]HPE85178.1 alpha,alpha-trehalase TreF [Chlamydiales bacterium]
MSVQTEGALFEVVQKARLFSDSKFFVDAIPKGDVLSIYEAQKNDPGFDLKAFILDHFELPQEQPETEPKKEMNAHIEAMWDVLYRPLRDGKESTLIDLPYPHVVPGGRFRECYYWDSYFTCEGLICAGKLDVVKDIIANFAFLIDTYGFVPNGNRTYYLSRSQQPYFSHLLALLHKHDAQLALKYYPQLEKEYAYWMAGKEQLTAVKPRAEHCVLLDDNLVLNRYFDFQNTPRPEAYLEDLHTYEEANDEQRKNLYRHLRAACESGWDFSSRWLKDHTNLCTIRTCDLVPVDLNCLLFHAEELLADFAKQEGEIDKSLMYDRAASLRKRAINRYFWHKDKQFFFDYDFLEKHQSDNWTLAAVFPLFVRLATKEQADKIAEYLAHRFLMSGGLMTTTQRSGQQWDAPNGWAPLQWIAVQGLLHYNHHDLAKEIASHWLSLNRDVFRLTHKMLEKYNVVDASSEAMAGEYAMQEGFGWTNAVALRFQELLKD